MRLVQERSVMLGGASVNELKDTRRISQQIRIETFR